MHVNPAESRSRGGSLPSRFPGHLGRAWSSTYESYFVEDRRGSQRISETTFRYLRSMGSPRRCCVQDGWLLRRGRKAGLSLATIAPPQQREKKGRKSERLTNDRRPAPEVVVPAPGWTPATCRSTRPQRTSRRVLLRSVPRGSSGSGAAKRPRPSSSCSSLARGAARRRGRTETTCGRSPPFFPPANLVDNAVKFLPPDGGKVHGGRPAGARRKRPF